MLRLTLTPEEYFTVSGDIVIQAHRVERTRPYRRGGPSGNPYRPRRGAGAAGRTAPRLPAAGSGAEPAV